MVEKKKKNLHSFYTDIIPFTSEDPGEIVELLPTRDLKVKRIVSATTRNVSMIRAAEVLLSSWIYFIVVQDIVHHVSRGGSSIIGLA